HSNSAPWRKFQSITRAGDMSAGQPFWISSWMTCSPTRSASRFSGHVRLAARRFIKEAAMQRFMTILLAAALAIPLPALPSFAHAFLDHAVPGVGMTVRGPVRELRLYYTQGVVTAFSHVHVVSAAGAQIPASKPVTASSDQQTIVVRLGRA